MQVWRRDSPIHAASTNALQRARSALLLLARYDIGALQRGTFKNSTLGVFINSQWSAFGTRNWARRTAGIPNWGHSDLGAQLGRKNNRLVCNCLWINYLTLCDGLGLEVQGLGLGLNQKDLVLVSENF